MNIDLNKIVTIDFESYYSSDFGLTKKEHNTSSYIRDPQFKVHCCAIKVGKAKSKCYDAKKAEEILRGIDWKTHAVLAHNTSFDGFILSHLFGIVPAFYLDTLSMTRGLHADVSRAKLDTIAKLYGLGAKHEGALENTKGKRDLTKDELKRLMEYCNNDNELCYQLFLKQFAVYPKDELRLIDITIRMFCDSKLEVDIPRAKLALAEEMLARRATILKSKVSEEDLQSNPKFADQLRKLGVEPPTKISLKTGHENYALAQTDPEFLELLDHEDVRVVRLAQARLAAKSTQVETRAARLIQAGENGMKLPAGYNYYAAKTGRWGGTNKCLVGDTTIIVRRDKAVLYIPLSNLIDSDEVWDGEAFVRHAGLVSRGAREVISYGGITGTKDHKVWLEGEECPTRLDAAASQGLRLKAGDLPRELGCAAQDMPGG